MPRDATRDGGRRSTRPGRAAAAAEHDAPAATQAPPDANAGDEKSTARGSVRTSKIGAAGQLKAEKSRPSVSTDVDARAPRPSKSPKSPTSPTGRRSLAAISGAVSKPKRLVSKAMKEREGLAQRIAELEAQVAELQASEAELQTDLQVALADAAAAQEAKAALRQRAHKAEDALKAEEKQTAQLREERETFRRGVDQHKQAAAAAIADQERAVAAEQRALEQAREMEAQRADALRVRDEAMALAETWEGKCLMAQKANAAAQDQMRESSRRERLRHHETERIIRENTAAQRAAMEAQAEAAAAVDKAARLRENERIAFDRRQSLHNDELLRAKEALAERDQTIAELRRRLAAPPSSLEQVRDDIKRLVGELQQALEDKVSEEDAFRGGETLRWKMIRARVETLARQVARIFNVLTSEIFDRDARLNSNQRELERDREAHKATKSQVRYLDHEREMLRRLFHPVPVIPERGAQAAAAEAARPHAESPVMLKARLLLSAVRADEVRDLIERSRTWDATCSTLLLSCCAACGAFFLDEDAAWPCKCAHENSLHDEHEPYAAFHDTDELQALLRDALLSAPPAARSGIRDRSRTMARLL